MKFSICLLLAKKQALLILIFILNLSFIIYHSPKAYAQSAISLGVDPPILQINATAPALVRSKVVIINRGDSSVTLKVSFKPFIGSDREDGQIRYVNEELGVDVKLLDDSGEAINELELSPKEEKKLTLSIDIPRDSPPSDYYFSIIFLTGKSSKGETSSSSESITGIASNVLLSIGSDKVMGEIAQFSAPFFLEKGPVPFTVRIKNTSSHFINPKGEILIKNIFGQTIGRVDLAQVNILANSVRNIPSEAYFNEGNLPDEIAAYWPQKFILGPYKASLSIALSDTGPLFKRSVFFFAFPAKAFVAVLFGGLLLIYITIRVRSKV